jgi:multidrug transporter EmrE-like cation transporter
MFKAILQTLPVLVFSYTAQVLLKKGSATLANVTSQTILSQPFIVLGQIITNWQIMLGFVLAGIGAIFYIFVLSKNDFGLIFPILGALGFIILPLISRFVLYETVTTGRIIGTIIIAIGMIIVARG